MRRKSDGETPEELMQINLEANKMRREMQSWSEERKEGAIQRALDSEAGHDAQMFLVALHQGAGFTATVLTLENRVTHRKHRYRISIVEIEGDVDE